MEFTAKPSALTAQDVLEILKGVDIEREMDDPERKLMAADSLFVALRKSNPKMEIHFILAKWVFEGGGENGEPHSQGREYRHGRCLGALSIGSEEIDDTSWSAVARGAMSTRYPSHT
jgi:hypothetical protein